MKIAVYCYDDIHNPRCGGGGAYREWSVHQLLSARHQIGFYSGNFKGAVDLNNKNLKHRHLGFKASYLLSRLSFSLFATIHSLFSNSDVIAIPFSIYSPVLTFLLRPRRTVVLFFHRTGMEAINKYGLAGVFPLFMEWLVLATAPNFITLTDSMAAQIVSRRPGVKAKAGYVSFDTSLFSTATEDENFILCFGRIDIHMKGIDILIPAFEKIAPAFPQLRLVIAGRGKEKDIAWLAERINTSTCKTRIRYQINTTDEEKKRLFQTATIVCMPSRFEGWNIAAIEAAASSKATVGTNIPGLSDAIRHNETGILVAPGSVDALAEAISRLVGNPGLRELLGKAGYAWAQKFSLEQVARIQEDFYAEVAGAHR